MDVLSKLSKIREQAIKLHGEQKYGDLPYEVHLYNVINVLSRYIEINYSNFNLFASGWLHDILEDTEISHELFIKKFGNPVYEIVWALTDEEGKDYNERKEKMYKKLIHNQDAIIVKLADRIANIEFSYLNFNQEKLHKYYYQNERFLDILNNNVKTKVGNELLKYLNFINLNNVNN